MTDDTELRDQLEAAANRLDLPAGDLAHVTRRGARRRRLQRALAGVGGATVVLAVIVASIALLDEPAAVDIVDQPTPSTTSPAPDDGQPQDLGDPALWPPAEDDPAAITCAYSYPEDLAQWAVAFDGTVIAVRRGDYVDDAAGTPLTLQVRVNETFTGDLPETVTMNAWDFSAPGAPEVFDPTGARILTATSRSLDITACGFTRPYSADDAQLWRTTFGAQDPAADQPLTLEPAACAPNAHCVGTSFLLDGVRYNTGATCAAVLADRVGPALDTRAEPPSADVPDLHAVAGYPIDAGVVVVDGNCDEPVLATPADELTGKDPALVRATIRCDVLVDPTPRDRCQQGGDAQWRAGPAWYDYGYAPFPSHVEAVDARLASGDQDVAWRADPAEVAQRRYRDESVCRDGTRACPIELAVADRTSSTARLTGTVHPFPDVVWDITILVERLGDNSWWTTRMTIQPRAA